MIVEVGDNEQTVMAFDKATGETAWTSLDQQPAGHTGGMTPIRIGKLNCLAVLTLKRLVIMQLDAADSHLEGGNVPKAQETVQRAMERARTTLREARRAIQSLRPAALEQNGLVDALGHV